MAEKRITLRRDAEAVTAPRGVLRESSVFSDEQVDAMPDEEVIDRCERFLNAAARVGERLGQVLGEAAVRMAEITREVSARRIRGDG